MMLGRMLIKLTKNDRTTTRSLCLGTAHNCALRSINTISGVATVYDEEVEDVGCRVTEQLSHSGVPPVCLRESLLKPPSGTAGAKRDSQHL